MGIIQLIRSQECEFTHVYCERFTAMLRSPAPCLSVYHVQNSEVKGLTLTLHKGTIYLKTGGSHTCHILCIFGTIMFCEVSFFHTSKEYWSNVEL